MKRKFIVELEMPQFATIAEVIFYIQTAVRSFKGGLEPEDPMFELDRDSVEVTRLKEKLI